MASKFKHAAMSLLLLSLSAPTWPQDEPEQPARQLEQARRSLEEAAREVARLSAEIARPVMREFGLDRQVSRARLGVSIEDADEGVRVLAVTPGSAAAQAGIVTGDIILAIDGAELVASDDVSASRLLVTQMANVEPDDNVELRVFRDGAARDLLVQADDLGRNMYLRALGNGPFNFANADGNIFRLPGMFFGPFRELELVSLTPELGAYFGTEEGLLVVRAPDGEGIELQDGDVIIEISGRTPTSPEHAMRILSSFEPGERLNLDIMRSQRRQSLEFAVPERQRRNFRD